ncbi:transposase [Maribacter sp. 2307ULW6-5]|uniref:transposase n=1 Tax=Maribacter sp. 2307ULW6-5 TaxID=3386275 RepID=UPI0039BCCFD7
MNDEIDRLLDGLVSKLSDKDQLEEVREQLFKRGVETLLKAELTAHLGYEKGSVPPTGNVRNGFSQKTLKTSGGNHRIDVPRDRQGTFEPLTVPKHGTMAKELEDCVLLLYARGMGNDDITDFVERTYGVRYSTSQVSVITDTLHQEIRNWRQRPLEDVYPIIWMPARAVRTGTPYTMRYASREKWCPRPVWSPWG